MRPMFDHRGAAFAALLALTAAQAQEPAPEAAAAEPAADRSPAATAPGSATEPAPEAAPAPVIPVEPVAATPEPGLDAQEKEPATRLDSVIVTAQKREEDVQDVPLSVQALSQDTLDELGISTQGALQQAVPGLDINSIAQFTTAYIRGVGTDAFLMADPSVAYYVDGIYFPFSQGLDQDFGPVERVEVLKGPQGTLFGRNAVGGAISVQTRDPDTREWQTSFQVAGASRDTRRYRLYQNIPVADWLAISFGGYDNRGQHYMRGTAAGRPLEEEISRGGRVKLKLALGENLDFMVAGMKLTQQGSGSVFQLNAAPSPMFQCAGGVQTPLCIQPQTGYEGALSEATFLDFDSEVAYGNLTWRLPGVDLKLLGSRQEANSVFAYDFDGSPQSIAAFDQKKNFADVDTAEIQILSNDTTWGASRFRWIAGGYYFKSAQGFDPAALQLAGLDLADQREGGLSLPAPLRTALDAFNFFYPNGDVAFHAIIGTRSRSGYFQGTLRFTDSLALTGGGRYQKEQRYIIRSDSGSLNADGSFTPLFTWEQARNGDGDSVPTTDETTSFKPKATLELRPFEGDVLFYATYQEAQKSSTYNTVAIYQPPAYVRPEEVEAVELGIKSTLFDGLLQFNVAAYRYDITDLQVQFISLFQGGAVSFENAGAATIEGLDAELRLQLLPQWFDRLNLSLSGSRLEGVYDRYDNASGFDPQTGFFSTGNDYSGNTTVRTPRYTAVAGLSKIWNWGGSEVEIGGDAYRNSGFWYSASNDARFSQPGYTLYGARLSWLYRPWGLSVTGYGRNLSDVQYTQGLIATDFGANYTLAPPRTYGVQLNLEF